MWYYFQRLDRLASNYIQGMTTVHWVILLVAVVLIGIMCMQGYGSRRRL